MDWRNVNPNLLARVNAIGKALGRVVTVTSGFRTYAHQRQLYAAYQSGSGGIAAPPGSSNHEYGLAVDAVVDGQALGSVVPEQILNQIGLHSLAHIGDAVHVELANASEMRGGAPVQPAQQAPVEAQEFEEMPVAASPIPSAPAPQAAPQVIEEPIMEEPVVLPYEIGQTPFVEPLNASQRAQTWQLIASQPGTSVETQRFARAAQLAGGEF